MNVEVYNSESFKTVADSIREKASVENKISFPNEFLKNIRNCNDSLTKRFTLQSYSSDKVVSIPPYAFYQSKIEEINFPNVTEVGEYSFSDTNFLTKASLESVTKIKARAFSSSGLEEICFPKATYIEDYGFYNCNKVQTIILDNLETLGYRSLESVPIKECNFPKLKSMNGRNFYNNKNLITVNLPEVEHIDNKEFSGCTNLVNLNLPNVKNINDGYSFENCSSLITVDLPNAISIGDSWAELGNPLGPQAFVNCTELVSVNAPNVETTGAGIFKNCTKLESISLPKLKSTVSYDAFLNCISLAHVDLPSINNIPYRMITSNYVLTELSLPSVKDVSAYGLAWDYGLKKIILDSVTNFETKSFYQCTNLDTLIIKQSEQVATLVNVDAFIDSKIKAGTGLIYVPDNLVEEYKVATNWSVFSNQIKPLSEYILCSNITLDITNLIISDNIAHKLNATPEPINTVEEIVWSSSDMSVAYVLADGTIIPKKNGETTITVKCGEAYNTCLVTVNNKEVTIYTDALYQLDEGTFFNGEKYINTGLCFTEQDSDFTILGDVTVNKGNGEYKTIFHCVTEKSPYPGYVMDVNRVNNLRFCAYNQTKTLNIPNKTQVSNFKFVITHLAGSENLIIKHLYNNSITTQTINYTYTPVLKNLYLGCNQADDGTIRRCFKGAIHEFALFDYVKSDEEIAAYLS